MVADISDVIEAPSKKSLATPLFLTKFFQQVTHRNQLSILLGQHDFNNCCNLTRQFLEKGFKPVLANHKKRNFFIENSILGWKSTTGKAAFE